MPKQTYAEIVRERKEKEALKYALQEKPSEMAMRLAAEQRENKMTPAEQAATNAEKVADKSPTDEFTDLRTAIDLLHTTMEVLQQVHTIPNLSEFNRDSLKNEYRVIQNLYFRMLKEEHEMFAKVFQGDEE